MPCPAAAVEPARRCPLSWGGRFAAAGRAGVTRWFGLGRGGGLAVASGPPCRRGRGRPADGRSAAVRCRCRSVGAVASRGLGLARGRLPGPWATCWRRAELAAAEQDAARRFLASHGDLRTRFWPPRPRPQALPRKRRSRAGPQGPGRRALCRRRRQRGRRAGLLLAWPSGRWTPRGRTHRPWATPVPQCVRGAAQAIAPALELGRELLTEASGPAQRLVARASPGITASGNTIARPPLWNWPAS